MTGNRTIFIVDDDEAVRSSLALLLECEGFAVKAFAGGRDFLASVSDDANGCLILDIMMPDMDGYEVLEALQARGSSLQTLVLTGKGDVITERRARAAGALMILHKPIDDSTLVQTLRRASAAGIERK